MKPTYNRGRIMKTETLTAEKLYETIEEYPDLLELKVGEQWHEIDRIENRKIINGAWISTGEHIYITCGHQEYTYRLMDEVTVRWDDEAVKREQEQWELELEADDEYLDGDPDGEPVEDDNQDNRLAWTHPIWIRPTGMQQAGTCPECGREGWVSLETQDISLEYGKDGHTIRIVNGFMCKDCATFWTQTIVAKVGDVISNTFTEGKSTA